MKKNRLKVFIIGLGLFFLFKITFGFCQPEIERATRETDRFDREKIEEKLREVPPLESAEIKPEEEVVSKEEEQKLFIQKINLVGCESFSPESFSFILEKYQNQKLGFSDLERLTKELEREYLKRGIIAAVFVPEQEIKEGIITLRVVEAKLGELQIQEHKYFKKERLNYYWKIKPGEVLRYDKISKSIQMMNKNPDRQVKASLFAGKKRGTTDILLTAQTIFPLHFSFSFDNEGSTSTGRSRIGLGMRHNNFLGFDDMFLFGETFGSHFGGKYFYHTVPLTSNGASLVYGYNKSSSKPQKEYAPYGIKSTAESTSFSLRQDLYKKDEYLGEIFAGFEAKDKTVWTKDGTLNRDRLRILNLGANLLKRSWRSTRRLSLEVSQGLEAFGASSNDNPLASRGTKPVFTKFKPSLGYQELLPLGLKTNLKIKGQISSCKLTPQEEFSLGGIDSVRGYPSGDYLADNATQESVEILIPAFFIPERLKLPYAEDNLKRQTTLVLFFDHGWGERRGALSTEKKSVNLLSIGGGVRFSLFNQAVLRLEWGFPLGSNRPISESGSSRFHFSVDFEDKLPEEIERIRQLQQEENIKQWAYALVNEELNRADSPLRQRIENYRLLAKICYNEGRLQEAKELYERILQISKSLYVQAENYIRELIKKEKELREKHRLAINYYKEGRLSEAKDLWQKIIEDAQLQPLVLEF